jgi:hypothetical protein
MSEQRIVVAVGSYTSTGSAEQDVHTIARAQADGAGLAVAMVEKGPHGELALACTSCDTTLPTWSDAVLGSALTVIAAPVGIEVLSRLVPDRATWDEVGAMVGHFWHNLPRAEIHTMSNMLEARQAALVVIGVNEAEAGVGALLARASTTLVTDGYVVALGIRPPADPRGRPQSTPSSGSRLFWSST